MRTETMETSTALDEAFERLSSAGFELPNGFINHGPMACEALAAVGFDETLDSWARRFANAGGIAVDPVAPVDFDWQESLGAYQQLPEWIGYFERSITEFGWSAVVEIWVPRLMPSLAIALFHAAIRTAHAVRAIDAADTEPRQAELARALGYWAACHLPLPGPGGRAPDTDDPAADLAKGVRLLNAFIEERIRARPEEWWFWVHRRWADEVYAALGD